MSKYNLMSEGFVMMGKPCVL